MVLLYAALFFALLEWFFEYRKSQLGIFLTKPTVMLLLMGWVWSYANVPELMLDLEASGIMWILFGLIFCLGGDVFLMLPERFFLPGLISFLLGHIFYIVGFDHVLPPIGSGLFALLIAVLLIFVAGWIYVQLSLGMIRSG